MVRRIDLKRSHVARSGTVRDINRQIVLNHVRENGPISRSDIAKKTALQRSTVSLIVDDLKKRGMIKEVYGESSGGRPPKLLSLQTKKAVVIGVAITTSKTTLATSDLTGRVIAKEEFFTDPDVGVTMSNVVKHAQKLIEESGGKIEGIGVSMPGVVNTETGEALFIPHFKWRDVPVAEQLEKATGLPVRVDNDANAAALAELWFGEPAIRDVRDFILVLVEEGVGTGLVVDGQLYKGKGGTAGEFGHMTIGQGAPVSCATGSRDCWEAFSSERAALARYQNGTGKTNGSGEISIEQLIDRAVEGDEAAVSAIRETAKYLGIGIANIIQGMGPESVVLAGAMVRAWPLIEDDLHGAIENSLCRGYHSTSLIASTLGAKSNLMGAISLILAPKFSGVSID